MNPQLKKHMGNIDNACDYDPLRTTITEYDAAMKSVGLFDRSYVGRLKITGPDGIDLMDRLSTNKIRDLTDGQGMYTVLTSNKGRILDLLFVLKFESYILLLTGYQNQSEVINWINYYTFTEDVAIEDETKDTVLFTLIGPHASRLLNERTSQQISLLGKHESVFADIDGINILICRTDSTNSQSYDIIASSAQGKQLWNRLTAQTSELNLRPISVETLELLRIEQGIPAYGKELTDAFNPLEANLRQFISFNKGCYIGQEVITRLDTYRKVQKCLVGLSGSYTEPPDKGALIFSDDKNVGQITSGIRSTQTEKWIGLGYVRKQYSEPGTSLTTTTTHGCTGDILIESLPFK